MKAFTIAQTLTITSKGLPTEIISTLRESQALSHERVFSGGHDLKYRTVSIS